MTITDNKVSAFSKTISALADHPALGSTALLKQWFDSSPEELRVAHNNLIDFMAANYQFSGNSSVDVRNYNASGLATTALGSIAAGTKALTLTTTPDFLAGQGINLQGAFEVSSLQITAPASASANCTVTLNGVAFTVALVSGDTAIQVATKIRAATYSGWTAGGTAGTDTVTFTSNATGTKTDASYTVGTTGATGVMSTTTQGTADQISTVSSVSGYVVTIADNSTRTITAGAILHSDTAAFNAAKAAGYNLLIPDGIYNVTTLDFTGISLTFGKNAYFSASGAITGLKEISPEMFGAKGDGTTDDTAALIKAFNTLVDHTTLVLKAKYRFTADLTITGLKHVTIRGIGPQTSYLFNDSTSKKLTISSCTYFDFINMGFLGNGVEASYGSGATGGNGLYLSACGLFNFTNVDISYNGGVGVEGVVGTYGMYFTNCRIIGNQMEGIKALSITNQNATFSFINCEIFKNVLDGIAWSGASLHYVGGFIEFNKRGINFDSSSVGCVSGTSGVFISCDFENNIYEQIKVTGTASYSVNGIEITGCQITNIYAGGDKVANLISVDAASVLITGFKLGANTYGGLGTYNVIDANDRLNASCEIMYVGGTAQNYYRNLGRTKVIGIGQARAVNGLIEQKGIPFSVPDLSDELIASLTPIGYWRLPVSEFGYISNVQLIVVTNTASSYNCVFTIYKQNSDGTYTTMGSGTVTQAAGGNATLTFSLGLGINPTTNSILIMKTAITQAGTGTSFKIKCAVCNGSF